jgi:hypothetical protein
MTQKKRARIGVPDTTQKSVPKITGKEISCVQMVSLDAHHRDTFNKKRELGVFGKLVTPEQFCMEIVTLPSQFFLPIGLKMANDWQKWT